MPVILSSGRSNTRKAARLAVYEATMIIAKPAHTMPRIRAEKLRGAPGGGEARSDWHNRGLSWSPKPHPSHMRLMAAADMPHLFALLTAVQGAPALQTAREPHTSFQGVMGLTLSRCVTPGRRSSPRRTCFPSLMVRGGRMIRTGSAAPPASPNPPQPPPGKGQGMRALPID